MLWPLLRSGPHRLSSGQYAKVASSRFHTINQRFSEGLHVIMNDATSGVCIRNLSFQQRKIVDDSSKKMSERAKWGRELHYKRLSFLAHLLTANIKNSLVKIGKQNYIFHLELSPSCSFRLVNSKTKNFATSCFIMMVIFIFYLFIARLVTVNWPREKGYIFNNLCGCLLDNYFSCYH